MSTICAGLRIVQVWRHEWVSPAFVIGISPRVLEQIGRGATAARESADPAAFRVWLAEADEVLAAEGWAAHDRMRTALNLSGLTPSEARAAVQAANGKLGVAELSEPLQTILGGVKEEATTASVLEGPEAPAA